MENEQKVIKYWFMASKQDFATAEILFKNKKYHHALFFCHLSIEKILKAIIVKATQKVPPLLHDLVRLAERAGINLSEKQKMNSLKLAHLTLKQGTMITNLVFIRKQRKDLLQNILL